MHFIFSIHFHAFVFLLLTLLVILIDYIFPSSVLISQGALVVGIFILQIYLLIALKKVYEQRWIITLLKLMLLNFMYHISVMIIFSVIGAIIFYL